MITNVVGHAVTLIAEAKLPNEPNFNDFLILVLIYRPDNAATPPRKATPYEKGHL